MAHTLNPEQKAAFEIIQKFLDHPAANVLVLKGYAGTGKTFLMQHVGNWLEKEKRKFCMLATTGRAAAVLKGKTGFTTKTVHSELYNFSKIDGIEEHMPASKSKNTAQMTLQFLLRPVDEDKKLYIIDEASMMSGELSTDDTFANFGSGVLLDDLFEAVGNNKIVFVGDPCQLPPVRQEFSPALDMDWLAQKGRVAISVSLQKVERTGNGNDILTLASAIRDKGLQTDNNSFRLPAIGLNNVKLLSSEKALFNLYYKTYKANGPNGALAIARSNQFVQKINRAMRHGLYGSADAPLQVGDILLVTQNNYLASLTNGDFVEVLELGEAIMKGELTFQKIRIRSLSAEKDHTILLSMEALRSVNGNLTNDQSKYLAIDFSKRMREQNISPKNEKYKKAMRDDKFINCLKASYGYAVTCHKSQGGEWDDVFLFLEDNLRSMKHTELFRWLYTAVTRARKQLHLVNNPNWVE